MMTNALLLRSALDVILRHGSVIRLYIRNGNFSNTVFVPCTVITKKTLLVRQELICRYCPKLAGEYAIRQPRLEQPACHLRCTALTALLSSSNAIRALAQG